VKVEKLAKNGEKGQNSQPLSPCERRSDGGILQNSNVNAPETTCAVGVSARFSLVPPPTGGAPSGTTSILRGTSFVEAPKHDNMNTSLPVPEDPRSITQAASFPLDYYRPAMDPARRQSSSAADCIMPFNRGFIQPLPLFDNGFMLPTHMTPPESRPTRRCLARDMRRVLQTGSGFMNSNFDIPLTCLTEAAAAKRGCGCGARGCGGKIFPTGLGCVYHATNNLADTGGDSGYNRHNSIVANVK